MDFPKKIEISEKLNLYVVKTKKFKTISINVFIHRPLDDNATKNALIPLVLRRGSNRFKTSQEISEYLEELYGAVFDCGVAKKGERHIIRFYIECINNKQFDKNSLFSNSISFISDIVFNPIVENSGFNRQYFVQEKENLKRIIDSKINDKMQYSMERCIEEMCQGEPYSIYQFGNIEDLNSINEQNLYEYYSSVVKSSPIDIFIIGDVEEEFAVEAIKKNFTQERDKIYDVPPNKILKQVDKVKHINEELDVSQAKLCMGFRTNIPYDTDDYYPLVLYSNILGGGLTSKLFMNVREKASLAYTIFSRLDKFKGIMMIAGGIAPQNYEKAVEIIFSQMDDMKNGVISEDEYNSSIKGVTTSIRSLQDSHLHVTDFFLSQIISSSAHNFEDLIELISSVKKEQIPNVAKNIELDTIYFLKGKQA